MVKSFFKGKVLSKIVIGMLVFSFLQPLFTSFDVVRASTPTPAYYFTIQDWGNEVIITGYSLSGPKDVIIPSEINGKKVTAIGDDAFAQKGLRSVVVPSSVKTIGINAFMKNVLHTVIIEEGVTTIKLNAFYDNSIKTLIIPDSLTFIGHAAFAVNNLTGSLTIPYNVTVMEDYAFALNDLTSVTLLPRNMQSLYNTAFDGNATNFTIRGVPKSYAQYHAWIKGYRFEPLFNISPDTATFDQNVQNQADIEVSMTLNEFQFSGITHNGTTLTAGDQYTRTGDQITIKKGYLASLPTGTETFKFIFEDGKYDLDFEIAITDTIMYSVTFNSNGGSSVTPQTVQHGNKATEPASPTREGYTFLGWYTESDQLYDFNPPVTSDLTLYAKWEINTYTVRFDSNGGTSVSPQEVQYGNKATEPASPTKEGYTFLGWYTGSDQLYDFNTPVTSHLTLFARWSPNSSSGSGSGGGSSSDDSSDRSSEKITEVITIDVETGNVGEVVVNKIPLTRIRENGNVCDQVTFQPQSAEKVIKAILETGQTTARAVIPDRKDEVSQIDFTLPKETKELFKEANVNLEIYTENGRIEIPSTSLNETDQDLYFRIVPIKEESKQKEVEDRAQAERVVLSIAQGDNVNVLGRPVTIETNIQNRPVTLTLPLLGVTLPTDAAEREQFLSELAIYVEHSDGEKELIQPQVVEYKPGLYGLQFTVDKFSTFAILQIASQAEEAVEEEEEQIQHHIPYIRGYADGTFKPERAITRAEMAAILARNLGMEAVNVVSSSFPDVPVSHWAIKEIEFVKSIGLMVGDDKGNFRPDAPITRGEIAAIAARYKNLDTSGFNQSSFLDVDASYWGLAAIEAVRQAGIIAGYEDGTYRPNRNVTRAEAVTIINRLFDRGPLYGVTKPSFSDVTKDHWAFYEIEEAAQEHNFVSRLQGGENVVK